MSMLQTVPLPRAAAMIREVFRCDRWSARDEILLTPDGIVECARSAGGLVTVQTAADWETREDDDLWREMGEKMGGLDGQIILVTEASFGPGAGAFQFDARDAQQAMVEHRGKFEPVYNGDVIVLLRSGKGAVCLHHEGHWITAFPFTDCLRAH